MIDYLVPGVFEVGPCKKGAPILMSLPHFMQADPKFREDVKEMSPDVSKHEFIMDHEPVGDPLAPVIIFLLSRDVSRFFLIPKSD